MAQETSLTSAKQLLSLIENPKAKDAVNHPHALKHQGMRLFSPGVWKGKLSFFKDNFRKYFSGGHHQPDLKLLNRILTIIIVITFFYLTSTFYVSIVNLTKKPSLKLTSHDGAGQLAQFREASTLKQTVAYYMDKIRQRDIFKIGAKKISEKEAPVASISKIVEATQHLRLAGISWSSDPDAMIEDTKALRTFFVKRRQMIGQVKIEAIFKDKVVVSYDGEEAELR